MKLQTIVDIDSPKNLISHKSSLLFIGSCFAENMGNRVLAYKFPTVINPCGIAYNPISIANSIALVSKNKMMKEEDFVFHNELWHSLHHHGRFSHSDLDNIKKTIQKEIDIAFKQLCSATHIFLTLGTAWVFEYKKNKEVVNNCHKLPANNFERHKLSLEEIILRLQIAVQQIREHNHSAEIIFTVSPVRHTKDGLHENQLSKAALLLGVEHLQQMDNSIGYFPAYEIAMDELRDYRFYAEDFAHLNELGINYIWERFSEHYFTEDTLQLFPSLNKLQKALNHKIANKKSLSYLDFNAKITAQIERLEQQLPYIDFTKEKREL